MTDAYAIKPCPFCGGDATLEEQDADAGGGHYITCSNPLCEASSALIYPLMDRVDHLLRERWNRRVPVTVSEKGEADDVLRGIRLKVASLHDKMLSDEYRTALRNEVLERIDAYLSRGQS